MNFNARNTDLLWMYPALNPDWNKQVVDEFNIHPVIAQALVSRNFSKFDQIQDYLYAKLPDLYDPYLMPDMDKAVDRICRAIRDSENILIYGDNDVDGMTGTALLTEFLRSVGANVFFYVPNRIQVKQSLILSALTYALDTQCKLLITVDCGITAAQEIEHVIKNNVDVIVTDHHEPTAKIPLCIATLNPKLVNNSYPNRELTGVGVAFKLAHAITNRLVSTEPEDGPHTKIDLKRYLDLVALGTIADMGSLLGENRILVRYGLRQLRKTKRIGLTKLCKVCDIKLGELTAVDIASKIAPRLNSLGRIADPQKGVELLLIRDPNAAELLAQELDLNNIARQKIEHLMSVDVENTIKNHPEMLADKAIVMYSKEWHPGVIAIVSTRITKQYNRPTAMIAIENGLGKGSVRTIREFPLLPILKENADLLLNFGGHDFAAGLTLKEEFIEEFKKRFIDTANRTLKDNDILSKLHLDAQANFSDLTFDLMDALQLLEPFGNENPTPIFYCDAKQVRAPKLVGNSHLKLYLEQNDRQLEGIAFGMGERSHQLRKKGLSLRVAYTPQINTFQNKLSIQLLIRDFKVL